MNAYEAWRWHTRKSTGHLLIRPAVAVVLALPVLAVLAVSWTPDLSYLVLVLLALYVGLSVRTGRRHSAMAQCARRDWMAAQVPGQRRPSD